MGVAYAAVVVVVMEVVVYGWLVGVLTGLRIREAAGLVLATVREVLLLEGADEGAVAHPVELALDQRPAVERGRGGPVDQAAPLLGRRVLLSLIHLGRCRRTYTLSEVCVGQL